ncbi:hypothetical protein DY000_02012545 [Brassica cretica]|uniref:Uncharacterized protein n=1 Tax=Brassica cretica TaxID=69181 RepID=A0ABQ7DCR8_BRACR|nr:hypothetical protein DY000_02012545 [Brassica cretica]
MVNNVEGTRQVGSIMSHTPSPRNLRERMDFPTDIASSGGTSHPNSRERRSALTRISEPDLRDHISPRPVSSLDLGRLQEVEIQYDGAEKSQYLSPVIAVNSGLPLQIPATLRLSDNDKAGPSQMHASLPPSALAKAASCY